MFIHVKLCGNCNLGLTTLGVFFGVELNCGNGFRPRAPDVKMSYCTVLRSAKKLLQTRSCLFKADTVRYRLSPLIHNNLYVRKYFLKTGLKVEAFRFL